MPFEMFEKMLLIIFFDKLLRISVKLMSNCLKIYKKDGV